MTALHDAGELDCPRCGAVIEDASLEDPTGSFDEELRAEFDCPDCGAPLELVIESALPEALGVDIWLEDRRESE